MAAGLARRVFAEMPGLLIACSKKLAIPQPLPRRARGSRGMKVLVPSMCPRSAQKRDGPSKEKRKAGGKTAFLRELMRWRLLSLSATAGPEEPLRPIHRLAANRHCRKQARRRQEKDGGRFRNGVDRVIETRLTGEVSEVDRRDFGQRVRVRRQARQKRILTTAERGV